MADWRVMFDSGDDLTVQVGEGSALDALARLAQQAVHRMPEKPTEEIGFRMGRLDDRMGCLAEVEDAPCTLRSPFESCDRVAGGVLGSFGEDTLLKLRFAAGAVELPMHAHEHSRRMVVVSSGSGFFHVFGEGLATFAGQGVRSLPVERGDVLVFDCSVVHTFSAPQETLNLLSYHAPFIGLEDVRQYTLPSTLWCPPLLEPRSESIA